MSKDLLIDPSTFRSQFNHVFIAVAPTSVDGIPHYRVEAAYKLGVLPHPPELPNPPLFPIDSQTAKDAFKDWFLTKLINSTRASLHAAGFKGSLIRTRRQLFSEIITDKYYDGPKPKTWKLSTPHHSASKSPTTSKLRSSGISTTAIPLSLSRDGSSDVESSESSPMTPKSSFLSRVRSFDSERFSSVKKGFSLSKKTKPQANKGAFSTSTELLSTIKETSTGDGTPPSPSTPLRKAHPRLEALSPSAAPSSPPSAPSSPTPRSRSSTLGSPPPPAFKKPANSSTAEV